ncbi:MAG: hypothetical protein BWY83_02181 [bacterium ADurb.Bin478]|nr:MAG: hypothetical protein BWY83_02181 [bacterium ADurb.Bin478]
MVLGRIEHARGHIQPPHAFAQSKGRFDRHLLGHIGAALVARFSLQAVRNGHLMFDQVSVKERVALKMNDLRFTSQRGDDRVLRRRDMGPGMAALAAVLKIVLAAEGLTRGLVHQVQAAVVVDLNREKFVFHVRRRFFPLQRGQAALIFFLPLDLQAGIAESRHLLDIRVQRDALRALLQGDILQVAHQSAERFPFHFDERDDLALGRA